MAFLKTLKDWTFADEFGKVTPESVADIVQWGAAQGNSLGLADDDQAINTVISSLYASGPMSMVDNLGTPKALYGQLFAALHQDDDAHDTCTLTACLNPLHPGPCKGWKHSLFNTSPGAWHALEAARVEKANKTRLNKIENLKAKGLPIPKKLLTPIVAKPHPHAGKTAEKAFGDAHQAGKDVSANAGVHVNEPGKVTLGQAVKTIKATDATDEKGAKGKKPTVASKGIAAVIAQEKVTPQYKLDKAAAITPEQWSALSHDEKAVVRGELAKIQKDGFGPQQKKATELLDKLHDDDSVGIVAKHQTTLQKVEAVKAETAKGATLSEAVKAVNAGKTVAEMKKDGTLDKAKQAVADKAAAEGHTPVVKAMTEPSKLGDVAPGQDLSPLSPPPAPEHTAMTPLSATKLINKNGSVTLLLGGKPVETGYLGKGHEGTLTFVAPLTPGSGHYVVKTKSGEKYTFGKGEHMQVVTPAAESKGSSLAESLYKSHGLDSPKTQPAHVEHAIAMANGTAPGASWSKAHLAAYQELSAEEFHSLSPDVQAKIKSELVKADSKFLDPKKKEAAKALLAKFASGHGPEVGKGSLPEPKDMSSAQINSRVGELLGTNAASPPPVMQLDEQAKKVGKTLADVLAENVDQKVLGHPAVASKLSDLAAITAQHLANTKAKNALAGHIKTFHEHALENGVDIHGNKLTEHDKGVIGVHKAVLDDLHQHLEETGKKLDADVLAAQNAFHQTAEDVGKISQGSSVPSVTEPAKLSEYDQDLIAHAYGNAWSKHASKAVLYGIKTYDQKKQMKENPLYSEFTADLTAARVQAKKLAVAHALVKVAEANVPVHEESGAMLHDSPEYGELTKALSNLKTTQADFDQLHKQAQGKLDKIRTDAGLKKRALPKLDNVAVKASAAETAYYTSAQHGGPNYGKHHSAKQYLLAKVGPGIGAAHKTSSDKYTEKVQKQAEQSKKLAENTPPPKAHVKPPKDESGAKGPNADYAGKNGYNFTPGLKGSTTNGTDWGSTVHGPAYVVDPQQQKALEEHLQKDDTAYGVGALKQFKWSINNMESKGASPSGKGALYAYSGSAYDSINKKLNALPPDAKSPGGSITSIDNAFAASPPLDADVVLYRGFQDPHSVFKSGKWNDTNVSGTEWTQRSYSSTSGNLSTAQNFAGYGGVVMRVIIPKEMQVHGINAKGGQHPGEAEIILQRGVRYRVVADYGKGKNDNRRYIDVMVVPSPYAKSE